MENVFNGSDLNQKTIFDHPSGLFVLFFTEMWERFSYYGMRAILVLFLTASLLDEGWGWERKDAMILYMWYTMLVYFTPLIGGKGLGLQVFNALQRSDTGRGLSAGLAIVLLAIIIDRITHAWTKKQRQALGLDQS